MEGAEDGVPPPQTLGPPRSQEVVGSARGRKRRDGTLETKSPLMSSVERERDCVRVRVRVRVLRSSDE